MYTSQNVNRVAEEGFTLVELMIALAMSGIVVAAVYAAYVVQQKTYHTQDQVIEMQQNLRAALEIMTGDIRLATYDPGGNAGADISVATVSSMTFNMDLNDNGVFQVGGVSDANETVSFGFGDTSGDGTNDDSDGDGIVDCDDDGDGVIDHVPFRRSSGIGGALQPIAENIAAVEFYYLPKPDSTFSEADMNDGPLTTAERADIQAVRVTLLAIAEQPTPKLNNTQTYSRGSGQVWGPFNDRFLRRALTTTVYVRNRGLIK